MIVLLNRHGVVASSVVVGSVGCGGPAFRVPPVHDWAGGGARVGGNIRRTCSQRRDRGMRRFAQARGLRRAYGSAARPALGALTLHRKTGAALPRRPAFHRTRPTMAVVARASGGRVGLVPCSVAAFYGWAASLRLARTADYRGGRSAPMLVAPHLPVVGPAGGWRLAAARVFSGGQMDLTVGCAT